MGKKIDKQDKNKKKKDVCIVSESKDIHDYPIYGDGDGSDQKHDKSTFKKTGILIVVLVIILGISSYFIIDSINKNNFKVLKKNYGEYVITRKDTSIYNKNKKEIGTISGDVKLALTSIKNLSSKDKYLRIDGTDYYVFYKDIKKSKMDKEKEEESYYIDLGINIISNDKIELYKDDKKIITLSNGINTSVKYMDKDYYYVNFLNDVYKVKKNKSIKESENKNNEIKYADHVSVLFYNMIDDNCGEDTCFKTASVKAHINKIKEAGYYSISKEDYLSYINGYIRLKENAILLAIGTVNDNSTTIEKELGVTLAKFDDGGGVGFTVSNKTSKALDNIESLNMYVAKKYFVIDDYVRIANGEDIIDNGSQTNANQGISVVNYHFFFDSSLGEDCNESICLEAYKLREHLQWLKDNGYKTLTIKEFADWMDGIIELPEKSVLLTIDDGAKGTGAHNGNKLIPLLEEYQMHATLFLIAGWWDIGNYQSPYLDVQSHTFNLHYEASCADGRGKVACSNYQEVKDDLQQSIDVIKDNTSFCFPFYSSDRESIQAVQDLGFRVAFVGGNTKAKRSNNKYLIPRYPIMDDIALNEFISIVD